MQTEPLVHWPEVIEHYLGFLGSFLAAGAIGFRYSSLRGRLARPVGAAGPAPAAAHEEHLYERMAQRAALIGVVGAVVSALLAAMALPGLAARRHMTVGQLVTGDFLVGAQVALLGLAILGFALAAGRKLSGWPVAAVGLIVGTLRAALMGQWARLVNPVHTLAGGLWIGTLFVLVVAGLALVLRDGAVRDRRGPIVAGMVNAFSPLALAMAGVVVLFGLVTAWRHLKRLDALWTTPYGYALMAKLCVVALVFALGAWNWRRQRPTLGGEAAAVAIRRSATAELVAAAVVLAITAVLVSLPVPRAP